MSHPKPWRCQRRPSVTRLRAGKQLRRGASTPHISESHVPDAVRGSCCSHIRRPFFFFFLPPSHIKRCTAALMMPSTSLLGSTATPTTPEPWCKRHSAGCNCCSAVIARGGSSSPRSGVQGPSARPVHDTHDFPIYHEKGTWWRLTSKYCLSETKRKFLEPVRSVWSAVGYVMRIIHLQFSLLNFSCMLGLVWTPQAVFKLLASAISK